MSWRQSSGRSFQWRDSETSEMDEWLLICWCSLRSQQPPLRYDVFLSYRWNGQDSDFIAKLFDCLSLRTLNGARVEVFRDCQRLQVWAWL